MPPTNSQKSEEITSLRRITKPILLELCKKNQLYQTPALNDVLYLHYQGFRDIEGLEEYTGLKCLWLECNAISEIAGLTNQPLLKCLFMQHNLLRKIDNLHMCPLLDTLNFANNHISCVSNCGEDVLPALSNLNLSNNCFRHYDGLKGLLECKKLSVLDLSNNRIDDALVVKIFSQMPELRVLVLQGNPVVGQIPQYRKTLILECKQLTYLDSRPVFPKDRACAEAWKRGGYEEEKAEHDRWVLNEQNKMSKNIEAFIAMKQLYKKVREEKSSSDENNASSEGEVASDTGKNENNNIESVASTTKITFDSSEYDCNDDTMEVIEEILRENNMITEDTETVAESKKDKSLEKEKGKRYRGKDRSKKSNRPKDYFVRVPKVTEEAEEILETAVIHQELLTSDFNPHQQTKLPEVKEIKEDLGHQNLENQTEIPDASKSESNINLKDLEAQNISSSPELLPTFDKGDDKKEVALPDKPNSEQEVKNKSQDAATKSGMESLNEIKYSLKAKIQESEEKEEKFRMFSDLLEEKDFELEIIRELNKAQPDIVETEKHVPQIDNENNLKTKSKLEPTQTDIHFDSKSSQENSTTITEYNFNSEIETERPAESNELQQNIDCDHQTHNNNSTEFKGILATAELDCLAKEGSCIAYEETDNILITPLLDDFDGPSNKDFITIKRDSSSDNELFKSCQNSFTEHFDEEKAIDSGHEADDPENTINDNNESAKQDDIKNIIDSTLETLRAAELSKTDTAAEIATEPTENVEVAQEVEFETKNSKNLAANHLISNQDGIHNDITLQSTDEGVKIIEENKLEIDKNMSKEQTLSKYTSKGTSTQLCSFGESSKNIKYEKSLQPRDEPSQRNLPSSSKPGKLVYFSKFDKKPIEDSDSESDNYPESDLSGSDSDLDHPNDKETFREYYKMLAKRDKNVSRQQNMINVQEKVVLMQRMLSDQVSQELKDINQSILLEEEDESVVNDSKKNEIVAKTDNCPIVNDSGQEKLFTQTPASDKEAENMLTDLSIEDIDLENSNSLNEQNVQLSNLDVKTSIQEELNSGDRNVENIESQPQGAEKQNVNEIYY